MHPVYLKDSIRWLDLGDRKVLQVRTIVANLDSNRQGTIDEVWEDVPVVKAETHDEEGVGLNA